MSSLWPKLRGAVVTAVAWAIPWALVGGALVVAYGVLTAPPNAPVEAYVRGIGRLFRMGALFAGPLGFIAGGTFAVLLSVRERARDLASVSTASAARLGAISGAAAVAVPMLIMAALSPRSPLLLAPVAVFAAAAGAACAYAMLAIARLPASQSTPALEEPKPESHELRAAHAELDSLLVSRRNLTTLGD